MPLKNTYVKVVVIRIESTKTYQTLTAPKVKFSIKDFFSKCDQTRRKLRLTTYINLY